MISATERDVISPFKIAVVLLIEKYGLLRPKYWDPRQSDPLYPPIITNKERKATCYVITKLIQGSECSLQELLKLLERSSLAAQHLTNFITALNEMYCNGIDNLLTLFESVEKFVFQDPNRIESFPCLWTSIAGIYLRQLNLSFRRLNFSQVTARYQKFRQYYEECYNSYIVPNQDKNGKCEIDVNTSTPSGIPIDEEEEDCELDQTSADMTMCSTEVMALTGADSTPHNLLAHPVKLPPYTRKTEETTTSSNYISNTEGSRQQAELFIAHQAALLDCNEVAALPPPQLQQKINKLLIQNPDLPEAHFLSYLNCLRVKEVAGAMHSLIRSSESHISQRDPNRTEENGRFRYSALNMAALHAQFGHRKVGLMALQGAIRLAQESNDHVCLQHALTWLYTLSDTHKSALVKRSLVKSSELTLDYLNWLGLLNHTTHLSKTDATPATLIQSIIEGIGVGNGNCGDSKVWGQRGVWAVMAAVWAGWGSVVMTALCSQLLLHISPLLSTTPDTPYAASPSCTAICNMALVLTHTGDYKLAGEVLQHCQEQFAFPSKQVQYWKFCQAHVSMTELLHQGAWTPAQTIVNSIATTHPLQARHRECMLLVAKGESGTALKLLAPLKLEPNVLAEPELHSKCLLVEAEALIAGNNCGEALFVLVDAINLARTHHLTYLAALMTLHLAAVQLELGLVREARTSLADGLDVVLAAGGVFDQARARLLAVKLQVCWVSNKDKAEKLITAAKKLHEVNQLFGRVRAYYRMRDTLYLKARLYHEAGHLEERNKCALEFRKHEQQHPCQSFHPGTYVF